MGGVPACWEEVTEDRRMDGEIGDRRLAVCECVCAPLSCPLLSASLRSALLSSSNSARGLVRTR